MAPKNHLYLVAVCAGGDEGNDVHLASAHICSDADVYQVVVSIERYG